MLKRSCPKCGHEERVALRDDGTPYEDSAHCEVCWLRSRAEKAENERDAARGALQIDHVDLADNHMDCGGWQNLTPGERSMVRMALVELRRLSGIPHD